MKTKKIFIFILLILSFVFIFSGCAKNAPDIAPMTANPEMEGMPVRASASSMDKAVEEYGEYTSTSVEPEKIITTITVTMQTKEFMDTTDKLNSLISDYKGYIENSNISYNNYINYTGLKSSSYTIRIPKGEMTKFVDELKEIGNIISENTNKEDITKRYRDTESRLRVVETKENRILNLLEKADKMEDIIALENQLSDIIYEKENLTANIMEMDDKVDYSTIYVNIEEVAKLTTGETAKTPFTTRLSNAFRDSLYFFNYNIGNLIISIVYFLPYALIIGIVLYAVWRFLRFKKEKLPRK
ncbi:MAG: DUF4349 domain-containing protein [Tissierellaceae bacterium]